MPQEWDKAIADYSFVLEYQPHLTHVVCMRARAYACRRLWDKVGSMALPCPFYPLAPHLPRPCSSTAPR